MQNDEIKILCILPIDFSNARPWTRRALFLSRCTFHNFFVEILCILTIDILPEMWYNSITEREVFCGMMTMIYIGVGLVIALGVVCLILSVLLLIKIFQNL